MSHCAIQYVRIPEKIGTPGSTGTLATAGMLSKVGTLATGGTKASAETPTTPGMRAIAERQLRNSGTIRN
jgi:hypothetical protein